MWRVLAACARGVSHEKSNLPCQDAVAWTQVDSTALVCAVADGLGSAPRSEEGARSAVETAVEFLDGALRKSTPSSDAQWRALLETAFTLCAGALHRLACAAGEPVESYDTTLLVAVVAGSWTAIAHVGDGAVVVWRADDSVETFSAPEHNEFTNIVTPITVPELAAAIRYRIEPEAVSGIAMLTDGLQPLTINHVDDSPHAGFFLPLFRDLVQMEREPTDADVDELRAFLQSDRVNHRTTDDKTLLWAVQCGAGATAGASNETGTAALG